MSYVVEKYKKEEVHMQGLAVGWYFEETDEFRPLMTDAVMELYLAGLIDEDIVYATAQAREAHEEEVLKDYIENHSFAEYSEEDVFEMKAAFGENEDVTNVFTGEILHLAEY